MLHSALTTALKGRLHFISSEPQTRKLQLRRASEPPTVTELEREPGAKTWPGLLFGEAALVSSAVLFLEEIPDVMKT